MKMLQTKHRDSQSVARLNDIMQQAGQAANPPRADAIYLVMICGDDGRVQYGSPELIGMTAEELDAYLGPEAIRRTIGVDMTEI